ncbi:L,D-transpeptidase family protein [Lichenibacterium dinghuense]|uniref:L,D-transpeptidase family protein n=1 Tax=Lichenibacterium dinghuense TaxID=2895977 RepID=UPI001F0025DA|nr:L,D-transpeptidase family protein [Lichenibacterium sp. 6Y81]
MLLSDDDRRFRAPRALTGRVAALLLSTVAVASFAVPAVAQEDDAGSGQAEWAQRYDSDARQQVKKESTPTLSPATVAATEAAVTQYQGIVAQGGWGTVPNVVNMHVGSKGQAVAALRHRLQVTGDLDQAAGMSPVFDAYVEAAVKRFQARHGLGQTGIVSKETVTALNIPADLRLKQLETNLIRLRSFSGDLGQRFVMANIPAASVETVENGVVFSHHVAGVGKVDRQSPVMQTKATDINFNPYWTVPASIIRKDLIPKMQADPNYLSDNHIRIFNKDNQEVPSSSINWHSMDATNYKYREDPGINNSLGVVRINIGNPYGVYMHDTPTKGVFGDDFRFVSSGCIRVQNVRDYVAWLLKDNPGWDRDKIDEAIRSGERIDVKLAANVPVYWVYITAWATPDGVVQFRDDIYNRDGLGAPGTVASAADQGDDNSAVEPALQQD